MTDGYTYPSFVLTDVDADQTGHPASGEEPVFSSEIEYLSGDSEYFSSRPHSPSVSVPSAQIAPVDWSVAKAISLTIRRGRWVRIGASVQYGRQPVTSGQVTANSKLDRGSSSRSSGSGKAHSVITAIEQVFDTHGELREAIRAQLQGGATLEEAVTYFNTFNTGTAVKLPTWTRYVKRPANSDLGTSWEDGQSARQARRGRGIGWEHQNSARAAAWNSQTQMSDPAVRISGSQVTNEGPAIDAGTSGTDASTLKVCKEGCNCLVCVHTYSPS